jgi:hypothetical protein
MRQMTEELSEARTLYQGAVDDSALDDQIPINKAKKGTRARERRFIKVFLSHKHKDYEAADRIGNVLRFNSAGRLRVFLSENIAKGDDWQKEIEKELYESDWFVLLFSGVDQDWAWCHHEAGFFRGVMYPNADRIVVLYPPNVTLPDPLKKYQAVKCQAAQKDQPDELDRFFKGMFGKPPYPGLDPINPIFADEDHASRRLASDTVIDAVGRLVVRMIEPHSTLILRIPDIGNLEPAGFPENAKILPGSSALRLFGVGDAEFTWKEFHAALEDSDPEIQLRLNESFWPVLCEACWLSHRRRRLMPVHTIFRAPEDNRNYQPMLSRIEVSGDNSAIFHINLIQVAMGSQTDVRDKSVARIFTALNLAHRFRWEIIDPYSDPLHLDQFVEHLARTMDRAATGGSAANGNGLATIWEAIKLIEVESTNRGVNDPEALPADFGPGSQERVRAMFPLWTEKRGRLQEAAMAGDVGSFARVLQELDPVNVEFISLASQRLGELVRADADHSPA